MHVSVVKTALQSIIDQEIRIKALLSTCSQHAERGVGGMPPGKIKIMCSEIEFEDILKI